MFGVFCPEADAPERLQAREKFEWAPNTRATHKHSFLPRVMFPSGTQEH
jgi:hypothetical protein